MVGRCQRPSSVRSMASWAALPKPCEAVTPAPISTALTAWIERIACARRPSSFSSHCTCEPSPGGTPWAITVTAPPSVSPSSLARSTRRTISGSSARSMARSGEVSSTFRRSSQVGTGALGADRAQGADAAPDVDAEGGEEHAGEGAGGDAGGGLAGGGALQDVAQVAPLVLDPAREVGVPRPRRLQAPRLHEVGIDLPRAHDLLPAHVVAVLDPEDEGRAEGLAAAHAAAHLGGVLLDLHPAAAAEAVLAAGEVAGEEVEVHPQPGGQSGQDRGEAGTVALTAGRQMEPAHGGEG